MNSKEQILADMSSNGVRTPFLLDDGTVSKEYGTIGKGMHAGLPGHSFVLIDKTGKQRVPLDVAVQRRPAQGSPGPPGQLSHAAGR
jgi:hypothetical protein